MKIVLRKKMNLKFYNCNNIMSKPYPLYEGKDFIVFYKPSRWIVDTVRDFSKLPKDKVHKELQYEYRKPFIYYIMRYIYKKYKVKLKPMSYGICNRLDINTSGAILVSKTNKNFYRCREIMNDKINTIKIYVCLVDGIMKKKAGFITERVDCKKKLPAYCYVKKDGRQKSCSYYNVVAEYKYKKRTFSLVMVRIFTGRTHQIRIHMKYLGHPIIGDSLYQDDKDKLEEDIELVDRMFLHNIYLGFMNNGEKYSVPVKIPGDLKGCLDKLKITKEYILTNEIFETNCNFYMKE